MKTTILIALSAVAALAATAGAQTADSKNGNVQLKDIPNIGPLFRDNPSFDLNRNKTAGTRLRMERTPDGEILQIEIVEQNSGEALRQIAAVLGANIVIDPAIQFLPATTRTFYLNDTTGDVFDFLSGFIVRNEPVEKWKSSAGTYFFAAKPAETRLYVLQGAGKPQLRLEGGTPSPNPDPFVINITPFAQPRVEPQPHWEKHEFNGNAVYFIPLPSSVKSTESK